MGGNTTALLLGQKLQNIQDLLAQTKQKYEEIKTELLQQLTVLQNNQQHNSPQPKKKECSTFAKLMNTSSYREEIQQLKEEHKQDIDEQQQIIDQSQQEIQSLNAQISIMKSQTQQIFDQSRTEIAALNIQIKQYQQENKRLKYRNYVNYKNETKKYVEVRRMNHKQWNKPLKLKYGFKSLKVAQSKATNDIQFLATDLEFFSKWAMDSFLIYTSQVM